MENGERKKRAMPERQQPKRGLANLLGQPVGLQSGSFQSPSDDNQSWSDNVDSGVKLGYKVIEDQILQGQRFAEKISKGSYDAGSMNQDMQDLAKNIQTYWDDSVHFYGKILESVTSEMSGVNGKDSSSNNTVNQGVQGLVDSFARAFTGFASSSMQNEVSNHRTDGQATSDKGVNVVFSLSSIRPVEVSINLQSADTNLVIDRLYEHQIDIPPISDISLEHESATQFRLYVSVADDQPAGHYSGVIYKSDTKKHCGTVSVTVAN